MEWEEALEKAKYRYRNRLMGIERGTYSRYNKNKRENKIRGRERERERENAMSQLVALSRIND